MASNVLTDICDDIGDWRNETYWNAFERTIRTSQFDIPENKLIRTITAADCCKYLGEHECDSEMHEKMTLKE